MKPGEIITKKGELKLNEDSKITKLKVSNSGDRPIQVGSHYHFFETNENLVFDRKTFLWKKIKNIASGTAVRFEPGQSKDIDLVDIKGHKKVFGFNKKVMGNL